MFFFVGAGVMYISATSIGEGGRITTSAKKKIAPGAPPSRQPSPSRQYELDDNWPDSAFKKQRPGLALSPRNIVPAIREFANWRIGLRHISANVKDYLSLFFSVIGTFFTWRTYRIQKTAHRRNN